MGEHLSNVIHEGKGMSGDAGQQSYTWWLQSAENSCRAGVCGAQIRPGVYSFGSCMQQLQDTELDTNSHRQPVEEVQ